MLMPSFCQVMVGVGEPVALQDRLTGLFRITSSADGWDSITGSSEEKVWKVVMIKNKRINLQIKQKKTSLSIRIKSSKIKII